MRSKYSVKLSTIVREHGLKALHISKDYESAVITTGLTVNRPAMR